MNITRYVFSLCLLTTLNGYGQEDMSGKDEGTVKGEGWVIELETDSVIYQGTEAEKYPETDNNESNTRQGGASGIEFIIGGQGKDGVAKKGKLPVDN